MNDTALWLAHAGLQWDAALFDKYRAALPGVDIVPFVERGQGLSSLYDRLAVEIGRSSRGLSKKYPAPRPIEDYDQIWLGGWSSAYALVRGMNNVSIDYRGVVLLDGGHTSHDADGTASDAGVKWAADLARFARITDDPFTFWFGHSDVDPVQYASTTEFASEVIRLAGPPQNGFHVEAFDLYADPQKEHMAALREWGPGFIARAMGLDQPDTAPSQDKDPPGVRALRIAFQEAATVREQGGHNAGPVSKYFEGAKVRSPRHGPAGTREILFNWYPGLDWCAASASWVSRQAGINIPIRLTVWELIRDARERGAWHDVSELAIRRPQLGDLVCFKRNGDPRNAYNTGHVGRMSRSPNGTGLDYQSLDGNSGVAWGIRERFLDDSDFVGWIEQSPEVQGGPDWSAYGWLCDLSDRIFRGTGSLAHVLETLGHVR